MAQPLNAAFELILKEQWWSDGEPAPPAPTDAIQSLNAFRLRLDAFVEGHPNARVFWKDTESVYLGATDSFAEDAGVPLAVLIGIQDTDPRIAFSRQGAKYQRDDRRVMREKKPLLGFLERQDVGGGEVTWLVTSKVPMMDPDRAVVGVLGAYERVTREQVRELRGAGYVVL